MDSQDNEYNILEGIELLIDGHNKQQQNFGENILNTFKKANIKLNQDDMLLSIFMTTHKKIKQNRNDEIVGSHISLVFISENKVVIIDPQKYVKKRFTICFYFSCRS